MFGAALSQILYARYGFAPSFFQSLPLKQLVSRSFEDIVSSGSPIENHEQELIRDPGSIVFLRADPRDYDITTFLGILTTDIFPLLEKQELVKFRINFLQSETWTADSLAEHFTLVFKYDPDGQCGIDVWRAGVGEQYVSNSTSKLWNLGDYLSRLTPLKGPVYFTLAFHATGHPEDPSIGVWKFGRHDFEDANLQLQQREEYSFVRVVRLDIAPLVVNLPATTPTNQTKKVFQVEPSNASIDYEIHSNQSSPSQKLRPGEEPKATQVTKNSIAVTFKNASTRDPKTQNSRANTSSSRVQKKAREGDGQMRSKRNEVQREGVNRNEASQKKPHAPKRRPKQPLQMYEDVASSMTETQEAMRESQFELRGVQPTKRQMNDTANVAANSRSKRPKSPAQLPNLLITDELQYEDFFETPPPPPVRGDISSIGRLPLAFGEVMIGYSDGNHAQSMNSQEGYAGSEYMIPDTPKGPSHTQQQDATVFYHERLFGDAAASSEHEEDGRAQPSANGTLPRRSNGQQKSLPQQKSMFDGGFSSDDPPEDSATNGT